MRASSLFSTLIWAAIGFDSLVGVSISQDIQSHAHPPLSQRNLGLWFVEHPQYSVALPGDRVYFSCETNRGSSDHSIRWMHNRQLIPENDPNYQMSNGALTLEMHPTAELSQNQSGEYQCVSSLHRRWSIASLPASLSIAKLEDFMFERPKTLEAYRGNDVVIECAQAPESNPPAFIQFYQDGRPLEGSMADESVANWELLQGETLLIYNVNDRNAGQYSCSAFNHITNEKKMSQSHTTLVVKEPNRNEKSRLTFRPRDRYSVPLGENITIPCVASGNPKPAIIWTRVGSNHPLPAKHGCLTIAKAKEIDSGSYMCAIYNGSRRFLRKTTVIVLIPPIFTKVPKLVGNPQVNPGQTVYFHCQASGTPMPDLVWYFNGLPLPMDENHVVLANGTLMLGPVTKTDEGVYQCFLSNNIGRNFTNVVLQVKSNSMLSAREDGDQVDRPNTLDHLRSYPPSKPNVTQTARDSILLTWIVPDMPNAMPIEFFKVQFREFRRGHPRSEWRTLDEEIMGRSRSFEVIGLKDQVKYRFRIVAVYANHDNRQGPLSKRFKLDTEYRLDEAPKVAPIITEVLPLSEKSLRVGWRMPSVTDQPIEGYFIFIRRFHPRESRFRKVTMIGKESHSYIFEELEPSQNYEIKVEAFNFQGNSPSSRMTRRSTLPHPQSAESSHLLENGAIGSSSPIPPGNLDNLDNDWLRNNELDLTSDVISDHQVLLYLVIGAILVGLLLVLIVCCSVVGCIQKRRAHKNMTSSNVAIHEKYLDTARRITLNHSGRDGGLDSHAFNYHERFQSDPQLSSTPEDDPPTTMETSFSSPNRLSQMLQHSNQIQLAHSVTTSGEGGLTPHSNVLGSSSVVSCEGSLNNNGGEISFQSEDQVSLGYDEYTDEPSRTSWKRRRKSEELL
ncbi:hypothetical protein TCAL_10687 [Tigriopus californicus]|uniref:Interference hedgehog n=1 Tax=Tigriopus californicus TaxID=6832 RepID=A0A553PG56_TIGCA|nr:interference hedgehog-like [Tigriopus californicus]TRY76666.1 hypothetical protein TCAL_10687 [Tigriopus californicus]|eukprot:TCALIF_10687-PA protein Name:"Similar to iHog Interference hedgehog (Drosophila ananassae)" AED:0.11 eAED:0.11 QI:0/-1/0/1/-1/1/1/0/897